MINAEVEPNTTCLFFYTKNTLANVRDIQYNYVINKSSNYSLLEQQGILNEDVINSSGTFYLFGCVIRINKMKKTIKNEIVSKLEWLKNNYADYIVEGKLMKHSCSHDALNARCGEWEILWQK